MLKNALGSSAQPACCEQNIQGGFVLFALEIIGFEFFFYSHNGRQGKKILVYTTIFVQNKFYTNNVKTAFKKI
jgi:hypothetical protein